MLSLNKRLGSSTKMTNQEKLDILQAVQTITAQRNRINELEQQLELMRESHTRFVERLQAQVRDLQERFESLLDPLERIQPEESNNEEIH
jgi:uncharacterized protein YhaN